MQKDGRHPGVCAQQSEEGRLLAYGQMMADHKMARSNAEGTFGQCKWDADVLTVREDGVVPIGAGQDCANVAHGEAGRANSATAQAGPVVQLDPMLPLQQQALGPRFDSVSHARPPLGVEAFGHDHHRPPRRHPPAAASACLTAAGPPTVTAGRAGGRQVSSALSSSSQSTASTPCMTE